MALEVRGTPQKVAIVGHLDDVIGADPAAAHAVAAAANLQAKPAEEKEEKETDGTPE